MQQLMKQIHYSLMKHNQVLLTLAVFCLSFFNLGAQNLYVDSSSTCTGTCSGVSWVDAYVDLQDALNTINSGDTVFVAKGTYYADQYLGANTNNPLSSFHIPDSVVVMGGYPNGGGIRDWTANPSVLSGNIQQDLSNVNNTRHIVYTQNVSSFCVVDGFVIEKGYAYQSGHYNGGGWYNLGSGIGNQSTPTIKNCIFENNYCAEKGGAMYNNGTDGGNSSPFISNCIFRNNQVYSYADGGAIYNDGNYGKSSPEIIDCDFIENSAEDGGAIYNNGYHGISSPHIISCSFLSNEAGSYAGAMYNDGKYGKAQALIANCQFVSNLSGWQGGALYNNGLNGNCTPQIINNTFTLNTVDNTWLNIGAAMYNYSSSPSLVNSIVWDNDNNEIYGYNNSNMSVSHCIINTSVGFNSWSNIGINNGGNSDEDPLFVDAANHDLTLQVCSHAIDGGITDSLPANIPYDLNDNPRIYNNLRVDIGAFEYQQNADNARIDTINIIHNVNCGSPYAMAEVITTTPSSNLTIAWDNGETTAIADSLLTGYHTVIVISPTSLCTDTSGVSIFFAASGPVIYVDSAANGLNTGCSWTDALTSLQDALQGAVEGDSIKVAKGTYFPDEGYGFINNNREHSFEIPGGVVLLGGYSNGGIARDWELYPTILSGEIQHDADSTNNTYSVVHSENLVMQSVVNGIIISGGYACSYWPNSSGGGWRNLCFGNVSSTTLRLEDCLFQNNTAYHGAAIYSEGGSSYSANTELINCQFENNFAKEFGGALYIQPAMNGYATTEITGCSFINSRAIISGGAINISGYTSSSGDLLIDNCLFDNNLVLEKGSAIANFARNYNIDIVNDLFMNCNVETIYSEGDSCSIEINGSSFANNNNCLLNIGDVTSVAINNSTFANNNGRAIKSTGSNNFSVLNNSILWDNNSQLFTYPNLALVNNCLIEGSGNSSFWGTNVGIDLGNNFDFDPKFIDPANYDLRLSICSEAIDLGKNDSVPVTLLLDLDGNPRIYNSVRVDLGAFEFNQETDGARIDSLRLLQGVECGIPFGTVEAYVASSLNAPQFQWDNGENTIIADSIGLGLHTLIITNPVSNCSDSASIYVPLTFTGSKIYVDSSAIGPGSGCSWNEAFTSLQNALWIASPGDSIFVVKGTYFPDEGVNCVDNSRDSSFVIPNGVKLLGGFPTGGGTRNWFANKTVLSGEIQQDSDSTNNSYHVVYMENVTSETWIDGFEIMDGCASANYYSGYGAGLFNLALDAGNNSSPVIQNCTFRNNSAKYGAGIYNSSSNGADASPDIISCSFLKNKVLYRGGAINSTVASNAVAHPLIANCVFQKNTANQMGGAIYTYGSTGGTHEIDVVNSSFVSNQCFSGEAIATIGGTCRISNCIIWDNGDSELLGAMLSTFVSNSIIKGSGGSLFWDSDLGIDLGNNFDKDPLFVDTANYNLQLQNCSPAIDAGVNDSISGVTTVDINGMTRIYNNYHVDLGAYEYQQSPEYVRVDSFSIIQQPNCNLLYGSAEAHFANPGSQATLLWDNGEGTAIADSLIFGMHSLIVLDPISNCTDTGHVVIDLSLTNSILYVDSTATGHNNGCDWNNAFTSLQDALMHSSNGDTIKVARGTYYPDEYYTIDTDNPEEFFQLKEGTVLLGGYPNGGGQRDWLSNETILSANIQQDNDSSNNSHMLVYTKNVSTTTVFDGFNLYGAYSDDSTYTSFVSAWYNVADDTIYGSSPKIANCKFINNITRNSGGAFYSHSYANSKSSPIFENCIFENNTSRYSGGAVCIENGNGTTCNPKILNSSFINNMSVFREGGALSLNFGSSSENIVEVENCFFEGNMAEEEGGAIYNSSSTSSYALVKIVDCAFESNTSLSHGGAIYNHYIETDSSMVMYVNCTFANNQANSSGNGGAIYNYHSTGAISNCSFTENTAYLGGAVYNRYSNVSLTNSIIWNNGDSELKQTSSTMMVSYCDVKGINATPFWSSTFATNGGNNIDVHPSFVDAANGDLHITACSKVIDMGLNDSIASGFTTDKDGNLRIYNNGIVDMGAYEFHGTPGIVYIDSVNNTQRSTCLAPFGHAEIVCSTPNGTLSYQWDNGETTSFADSLLFGKHWVWATNTIGNCVDSADVNILGEYVEVIYVDSAAMGANTGCDWSNAFVNLQDALLTSMPGDTIKVAKGTYFPDEILGDNNNARDIYFTPLDSVIVMGGYPTGGGTREWTVNPTVLSGDVQQDNDSTNNSYHVLYTPYGLARTEVDGFIITGGYADGSAYDQSNGGGWYSNYSNGLQSHILRNCTFIYNYSKYNGGAIYSSSCDTINYSEIGNCYFLHNAARYDGGAIYHSCSGPNFSIVNSSFWNNTALGDGGAFYGLYTEARISNCSFSRNIADHGGGIFNHNYSSYDPIAPSIINCILWGNISLYSNFNDIDNDNAEPLISSSIVKNCYLYGYYWPYDIGIDGGNNLDVDPHFVDTQTGNLRLQSNTLATNAGTNNGIVITDFDLDGNPRIIGGTIDMGCYELTTLSSEKQILSFSVPGETTAAYIDSIAYTVDVIVLPSTDITSLIATFTLSDFANAKIGVMPQTSGVTAIDFSSEVEYMVTAQDLSTQSWLVKVCKEDMHVVDTSICDGETYTLGNSIYTTQGSYVDTLYNALLCDSIITTNLTVLPVPYVNLGLDSTILITDSILITAGSSYSSYLWSTGETTESIYIDSSQIDVDTIVTVWVQVTNNNACIGTDTVLISFLDPSKIDDLDVGKELKIYPNPSSGIVNIKSGTRIQRIEVFNATGQLLQLYYPNAKTFILNLGAYQQGLYYVKLNSESGSVIRKVALLGKM